MQFRITWVDAPWLVTIAMEGHVTVEEFAAADQETIRYLDGANGNLYWICDLRGIGEPGSRFDPKLLTVMTNSPVLRNRNLGMFVSIGSGAMMAFITTVITQKSAPLLPDGVPLRLVSTWEEAETLCRSLANADEKRATKSATIDAS